MNKIYYSDGQYGKNKAAKYFYNKELDQLTSPQIAFNRISTANIII